MFTLALVYADELVIGPSEWEGRLVLSREGNVALTFTPLVDGYYKVMIFENVPLPLLLHF